MNQTTAQQDITLTARYQDAVRKLVDREVHYCVSHLISELAQLTDSDYYEDIFNVCAQDDWQEAAEEAGWSQFTDEFGANCYRDESDDQTYAAGDWQELCEAFNIDPYVREAYEHWIVSDWLAGKLEEAGEMVSRDIYGLTIWGRCTTGQAILLDGVMCGIYNDMGATWHLED